MPVEKKKVIHPFFSKQDPKEPSPDRVSPPPLEQKDDVDEDPDFEEPAHGKGPKKRTRKVAAPKQRKKDGKAGLKGQSSLESFTRRGNGCAEDQREDTREAAEESTLEPDPNPRRSKRRKTDSPAPQPAEHLEGPTPAHNGSATDAPIDTATPSVDEPTVKPTVKPATPKKVLRVNKNGKLLSSPAPLQFEPATVPTPKPKRGRKPKAKPSRIVTINYGSSTEARQRIGQKIDDILNGVVLPGEPPKPPKKATPKKPSPKAAGPPKPAHPFFTGKLAKKDEAGPPQLPHPFFTGKLAKKDDEPISANAPAPSPLRTSKISAITPGKLKAERRAEEPPRPAPAFGSMFGGNRTANAPGTIQAPWPTKDCAHVRNFDERELAGPSLGLPVPTNPLNLSKRKRAKITVPPNEDIFYNLAKQLKPTSTSTLTAIGDRDVFRMVDESVRLPTRLLTTGIEIQQRLCKELSVSPKPCGRTSAVHPAIGLIFNDIEHTLTPFDKGECDSQAWVQKYAPSSAAQVLQAGKEVLVLRDWLQNLTVMAVHVSKESNTNTAIADSKKPAKKKRKRMEDDFIVEDDELMEDDALIDLSDREDFGKAIRDPRSPRSKRSTIMSRNKNLIILSGPHGCGKSASVYAVAKELGFEVFEINSSTRRSAKDIQNKVGDMSENHLVNHQGHGKNAAEDTSTVEQTDNDRMDEAFQKDMESGRQGTMMSFFQSKPNKGATSEPKGKSKAKQAKPPKASAQATLPIAQKPRRTQKQSLILFEEADVLFEEDQQFWAQVTKLVCQSKRPVVITCNDESRLPNFDSVLGAYLRLTPPPTALATDYMLTLAAKEGHVLGRKAVRDLYESRNHDLRASITELNLWCQMSVGDRKGGLEWMYQRWPPGKDVDEWGRTLRVASEHTYLSGMGLTSHDIQATTDNVGFDKEEAILRDMWKDWGIGPSVWNRDDKFPEEPTSGPTSSAASDIEALSRMDDMLDAVSSVDVYCRVGLPTYERFCDQPTDPSLPPVMDKERLNYTVDARFLQVDFMEDFSSFDTDMAVRTHLGIRRVFGSNLFDKKLAASTPFQDRFNQLIMQNRPDAQRPDSLARPDFSEAFDILASPPDTSLPVGGSTYPYSMSSFDRTFKIVVEDLAPFVRSIVAHEQRLEEERIRLSNFLSEGGQSKRRRTTRASRVALEGGTRQSMRREHWFDKDLNRKLVMGTAGPSWSGLGAGTTLTDASSRTESLLGTQAD